MLSEIDDDDGRRREGPPARAVVGDGKVYIRTDGGREELYDLASDPAERNDLSRDPLQGAILARLRRLSDAPVAIATGSVGDSDSTRR